MTASMLLIMVHGLRDDKELSVDMKYFPYRSIAPHGARTPAPSE